MRLPWPRIQHTVDYNHWKLYRLPGWLFLFTQGLSQMASPFLKQVPLVLVEILPVSNASVSLSPVFFVVCVLSTSLFYIPVVIPEGKGRGEAAVTHKVLVH